MRTAFINNDGEGIVISGHPKGLDILIYLDPRKTKGKVSEEISLSWDEAQSLEKALSSELVHYSQIGLSPMASESIK